MVCDSIQIDAIDANSWLCRAHLRDCIFGNSCCLEMLCNDHMINIILISLFDSALKLIVCHNCQNQVCLFRQELFTLWCDGSHPRALGSDTGHFQIQMDFYQNSRWITETLMTFWLNEISKCLLAWFVCRLCRWWMVIWAEAAALINSLQYNYTHPRCM